jgi:putative intracellular protease/amidase
MSDDANPTTTTVHLAVYDTLADWETGLAAAYITNDGWQRRPGTARVVTVGLTREPVTTMAGTTIVPDIGVDELRPGDSAMLILPGADLWLTGDALAPFVGAARAFLDAGVPVAAICGATWGLAAAGLLDGRRHTSNAREFLAMSGYAGGADYVDEPAVVDGDLVTGSGVAPVEFARAVLERLDLYEPHVLASWYKLYGQQDPAGFAELSGVGAGAGAA